MLEILANHHTSKLLNSALITSFSLVCFLYNLNRSANTRNISATATLRCLEAKSYILSWWPLGYSVTGSLSLSLLQSWTCLWKGPQMGSGIWQCVDSCLLGKQRPVVIGMLWPHSRSGYWCHHSPLNARAAQCQRCHLMQDWTLKVKSFPKFAPNVSRPTVGGAGFSIDDVLWKLACNVVICDNGMI